jgi:hypothetical protein
LLYNTYKKTINIKMFKENTYLIFFQNNLVSKAETDIIPTK